MFWEHRDWSDVEAPELAGAFALVHASLPAHERAVFALLDGQCDMNAADDRLLRVHSIRVRCLHFYGDYWLYELGLSPEATGLGNRYESARAYVVLSTSAAAEVSMPEGSALIAPHRRPAPKENGAFGLLLDWTAGVIFQLNERSRMQLAPDGRFDRLLAVEYLDFFVSFIASETTRELFLLVRGGTLAQPAGIARRRATLPSFEQSISQYWLGGEPYRRPPRHSYIPEKADLPDEPDIVCVMSQPTTGENDPLAPSSGGARTVADRAIRAGGAAAADRAAGDADATGTGVSGAVSQIDPAAKSTSLVAAGVDPERTEIEEIVVVAEHLERTALELAAELLHEGFVYRARFEIACSADYVTRVRMLEDAQLMPVDPSLLQYQIDRPDARDVRLLLLQKPRTGGVTAVDFLAQVRKVATISALSPGGWVENQRVSGDVDFQLLDPGCPVRVRDVEFLGRVVLDECGRDTSVVFERCRFARSFDARNCAIDGDLVLRGSSVLGAVMLRSVEQGNPLPPSICLAGLRLSGDLDCEQLEVDGQFAAPNAHVGGKTNLRGIELRARHGSEQTGISLCNAELRAGLDLSPHIERNAVGQSLARSRVSGMIDLAGLRTWHVDMRGAVCAAIGLSYAQIDGLLNLGTFDHALETQGAIGNKLLRAIVHGYVDLRCARAQEVYLIGAVIGSGLYMIGTEVDGSVFACPSGLLGYRCKIGEGVDLSSARIRGDADFDGVRIDGVFKMRTGSLGRLQISQSPVALVCGETSRLDYFAAELDRLELVGITGTGAISLVGIQIGRRPGSPGGVLFEHFELRGDIRFYWGPGQTSAFGDADRQARQYLEKRPALPGANAQTITEPIVQREASARTCRAVVRGSVDMRRIVTGGHIDLTNLRLIDGSVRLNDVRIGTDLFARRSWLRGESFVAIKDRSADSTSSTGEDHRFLALECRGMDLDNAHVAGDAFLSGIELSAGAGGDGRFSGRGLSVGGVLEFFGGSACMARIEGGVNLAGARAAYLSLPGRGALCAKASHGSHTSRNPDRVVLERGRFGKLHIDRPIPRLDLSGIEVSNWKLGTREPDGAADDVDGKIAILSQMDPMDRSVWIGVESELRNEARAGEADRVYREMKDREPPGLFHSLSRFLYGYGTNVWPAFGLWVCLLLVLFTLLQLPDNVKASDSLLLQLDAQCRMAQARGNAMPAKCETYFAAIAAAAAPALEITAAQLQSDGAQSGYDLSDAALLSLRYAIPLIGAFGSSDWAPVEQRPARIGIRGGGFTDLENLGVAPSILAAFVLLASSILLSFLAAFIAKRWLR